MTSNTIPPTLLALALLALLPAASAHLEVTATAPSAPLPVDQPTAIQVTLHNALCPVVLAEYAQKQEQQLAIVSADPPAYLASTGDVVPFFLEQCDSSGGATNSGTVTLTPSRLAPAFQPIPLQLGAVGETNEGGYVNVTVSYYVSVLKPADVSFAAGQSSHRMITVASNADTVLLITAGDHAHHGGLNVSSELDVPSPLLAGSANRTVHLPLSAASPGNHTLTLTPVAKADRSLKGNPVTFTVTVLGDTTQEHDHDEHEHADSKDAPAPVAPLLALGLLALALRRRA